MTGEQDKKLKNSLDLNILVCFLLVLTLVLYWLRIFPFKGESVLIIVSLLATLTVFYSAILSLKEKRISIDLLASIALFVSLIEKEWISAIFINLMIASARFFFNFIRPWSAE